MSTATVTEPDLAELEELRSVHGQIRQQMARQIIGQNEVVDQLLIAVFARGHCILEGVPGLAKTLMVHSLAQSLSLEFSRIQFTPDLMPSDITGTEVLYEDRASGARELRFVRGPLFANLVLADEINRTPPKTQAALLEAMQERQVTAGGHKHRLPEPFFVLATQNPIEQEGTYPLPEAQLDRFLFKIFISYPTPEEERMIYRLTTGVELEEITPLIAGERIAALQKMVRRVPVSDYCIDYAMDLVRATRGREQNSPKYVSEWVSWGAGPRGAVVDHRREGPLGPRRACQRERRRHPCHGPAGAKTSDRFELQRPGRKPDQRLDHRTVAGGHPGSEGGRRCRRRERIPILTSSPRSPTSP